MNIFLKSTAGILIAVIIGHSLSKQNKDTALLLVMGVCVMVLISAMEYFQPVVDFFQKLQSMGNLDSQMLSVLLKTVGIGILSEITALICADSGNAALGKGLRRLPCRLRQMRQVRRKLPPESEHPPAADG